MFNLERPCFRKNQIIMKFLLTPLLAGLLLSGSLFAQTNGGGTGTTQDNGIKGFWECETSGGRFVARLDQITSVSEHTYLIDGGVRVYECTIGTDGGLIARYYFLEPITENSALTTGKASLERLKSITNKVTAKTGHGDVDTIVTKHYPDTTHAKTSEYRLKYKDTIKRIYDHAHRVWAEEKGRGEKNKLTIIDG